MRIRNLILTSGKKKTILLGKHKTTKSHRSKGSGAFVHHHKMNGEGVAKACGGNLEHLSESLDKLNIKGFASDSGQRVSLGDKPKNRYIII